MYLTKQEQKMLDGAEGYSVRKSMEILVALGEIYGAKSLIKIGSVQVSGVSYNNLGDAGLEFLTNWQKTAKSVCSQHSTPQGWIWKTGAT